MSELTDKARDILWNPSSPIPYDVVEVVWELVYALDSLDKALAPNTDDEPYGKGW